MISRRLTTLALTAVLFGAAAIAQQVGDKPKSTITENTWYGALVDMACKERAVDNRCPVSAETERYGISVDGGMILFLDEKGNEMVRETLKKQSGAGNPSFSIRGNRSGKQLNAQAVQFEKP